MYVVSTCSWQEGHESNRPYKLTNLYNCCKSQTGHVHVIISLSTRLVASLLSLKPPLPREIGEILVWVARVSVRVEGERANFGRRQRLAQSRIRCVVVYTATLRGTVTRFGGKQGRTDFKMVKFSLCAQNSDLVKVGTHFGISTMRPWFDSVVEIGLRRLN